MMLSQTLWSGVYHVIPESVFEFVYKGPAVENMSASDELPASGSKWTQLEDKQVQINLMCLIDSMCCCDCSYIPAGSAHTDKASPHYGHACVSQGGSAG